MTHLLLDIGNTRVKIAVTDHGAIVGNYTCDTVVPQELDLLCRHHNVEAVAACVVGCRPDFEQLIPDRLKKHFHLFSYLSTMPVTIDYDTPETLGMDRVAAAIGARELCHGAPLLVVDAGSCITVDLLDDHDVFQGGAILPGLQFRLRAMHDYTAALPLVELAADERDGSRSTPITGKSTRSAIVAGVCNASLFEIQGFVNDYKKRYPTLKLFLTGGDAEFFARQLFFTNFAQSELVFIGLDKVLKMNI